MPGGRPPQPLARKAAKGRSPGRDSGGRELPATLTVLPGIGERVPPAPTSLQLGERAGDCPDNPRSQYGEPCPVCVDERGRQLWDRLWTAGRAWLSASVDVELLEQICSGRDEEAHHVAVLAAHGRYVSGQRGGVVAHPAVAMLRAVRKEMMQAAAVCGFTPSDRARLGIGTDKPKSKLEEMLASRASGGSRAAST